MKHTEHKFLFELESPYVSVGRAEPESSNWIPSFFYSPPGLDVCVRRLRGDKMRTKQALMDEFAAAFQFFSGFGENYMALQECLEDLNESLRADGYVLIVDRSEELLADEPDALLEALLFRFGLLGEYWSKAIEDDPRFNRAAKPFQVLLHLSDGTGPTSTRRISDAAEAAASELASGDLAGTLRFLDL